MAKPENWNFDCPQFVDFVSGLNDSSCKEDIFFDCDDHASSPNRNADERLSGRGKYLTEEAENKLIDKMTAALSVIENTPKLKGAVMKGKLFSEKTPKPLSCRLVAPVKPITIPVLSTNLHRSKGIALLSKIMTDKPNKAKEVGLRKRSSSLNDLRTIKKHKYPTTPMCLKRTIFKTKSKVLKSTEELELEEIAKLQNELKQHLRNNEISFKRLKLRPRPCVAQKNTQSKPENFKENKGWDLLERNFAEKETRRNFRTLNHVAMKSEAMKVDAIINGQAASSRDTGKGSKDICRKSNCPSVSSSVSLEVNEKNKVQVPKKYPTGRKYGFHSGLVFHDNIKKSTSVKPFRFDIKLKAEKEPEASFSTSILNHKFDDGKENIPFNKPQSSVKKTGGMQNIKYDIKQYGLSKKIGGKGIANPMRGFPLADNFARN